MPNVFEYTDYRQLLKDFYEEQKKAKPHFSYQYFANKAGFKAKTFFYKVIKGERALSRTAVLSTAQVMGLGRRETQYFEALVNFNDAISVKEREYYFRLMQSFLKNTESVQLRENQYRYFSEWYYPVIRELVTMGNFGDNYQALGRAVRPPITAAQARKAVDVLLELELIQRDSSGRFARTHKALTTKDPVQALAVHKFQKENMRLAAESIDRFPKEQRDISTLTLGINRLTAERIRDEIKEFRRYLLAMASEDNNADCVYQINFQVFPLSEQVPTEKPTGETTSRKE